MIAAPPSDVQPPLDMLRLVIDAEQNMKTRTLLQSMRVHSDFEDFTILGSQFGYRDQVEWHVAVWSEGDNTVRTFCIVGGVPEERLSEKRLEAVQAAIANWDAHCGRIELKEELTHSFTGSFSRLNIME